jgi:hypothetical protein
MEDPLFTVHPAGDYYTITGLVPGSVFQKPAWAVLDEKDGGYIAFTTDEEQADRIARAMNCNYNSGLDLRDWKYEIQSGDTRLGFDEWVAHKLEAERN